MKDIISVSIFVTTLQIFILSSESYNLSCPSQAHWKFRATEKCKSTLKYFCLYNNVEGKYVEGCKGPDWDRKGSKRIYIGDFSRGDCIHDRFQPFKFRTNGSMSDCIYVKSICKGEGQIVYKDDSTKYDRTCRCDYKRNYSFITTPNNLCYCIPTEEDCSCYIKACPVNFTLSADYECAQSIYKEKAKCIAITKFYDTIDETSRVHMENDQLLLKNTPFQPSWRNTVLSSLCFILIIVAGGFAFAVFFQTRTNAKLQPCKRFFLRDQAERKEPEHAVDDEVFQQRKFSERTKEEVNFLRMVHLLFRVACPVVRMCFNNEIQPSQLQKTLNQKKLVMEKNHRRKKTIINDFQWNLLYKHDKATSNDFDIRLMIYILRTLEIIKVGEVYPFPFDTSKSAMLSRITYIRNETIQNFDGKLSDDQFNQYWDDIGQAVLTLVTWHIQDIQDDEDKTQLFGNLLRLNPIKIDKKILCSFIHMSETYPALILEQLISEYCKFKDMEIAEILLEEKHKLFHKRIKTESCCKCTNSFVKEIPEISEKQWEALYEMIEDNNSHFCKSGPNKCSERFVPKTIKTCDLSVTMILFLHIPDILSHTINRSCINEFYTLLEKNKHTIYHSMEKEKCCACNKDPTEKLLIKKEEWNRLFQKENRKPCQTGTKDCCCEYSARRGLEILNLEGTFLSKIFHVAGPISILNKVWQDAFLQFLNWTIDDQPLREALTELLNKSTDKTFYNDMLKRISQCNFSELDETLAKQVELRGWCSKHLRNKKASTEPQLKILVFGKDGWKVESVHVPKDFPLPKRTRELQNVTVMENNFIVVMYGLTNIVYSVVENEFNTHCPDSVLKEICSGIYKDFFKDSCNGKDKGQKERILLSQKQREQIFSLELKDSKKFDLELMIFLLKRRPTYEGKNDYDFQLETIDNINRQIIQSSSGALDEAKFKEIMEDLTKALVNLGGKVYEKKLLHLQHVRNILEYDKKVDANGT